MTERPTITLRLGRGDQASVLAVWRRPGGGLALRMADKDGSVGGVVTPRQADRLMAALLEPYVVAAGRDARPRR
jgi:hypothetical protein